jgi:transposase
MAGTLQMSAADVVDGARSRHRSAIGWFVGDESHEGSRPHACATSHHWARELTKLGHEVRLMPAKDVKAYVKRNKNDAADAEAICEAVRRPTMRFVRIKSAEQQGRLMQHRTRDLLMRQRTQLINALRAHSRVAGHSRHYQCRAGAATRQGNDGDACHDWH